MTIVLGNAQTNPRAVTKTVSGEVQLTGMLKAGTSITDPVIERVVLGAAPITFNYMKIPDFGRNYFITDIEADDTNGLWRVYGHVDVLATYWDKIAQQTAIVNRQESDEAANLYLPDPKFPLNSYRAPQVVTFPRALTHSMSGRCCILTLVGADYS